MPFAIVRNDIAQMTADAIVNSANPQPVIGWGTDSMIHEKAGPELLAARQKIGPICVGSAAVTPAFKLHARYVIHTVGPVWEGGSDGEEQLLRRCYDASLNLALAHGCESVAFPLISTGNYGFPRDKALRIAIAAFSEFLLEHEMAIFLVVFDRASYRLSEKLFQNVASYINENYVDAIPKRSRSMEARAPRPSKTAPRDVMTYAAREETVLYAPMESSMSISLEDMLKQEDAGFSETLMKLIDKTGKKDSEIYKRAGLTKQHFSKIRNNPNYKPTKPTAIALALALELDLDATRDLIGRAGYALTNSSKFDLIIRYFIEQKNYNVVEINCVLFAHDQSLLGA